jgi:Rps23 Pro-64 3,4-dihydroxylase Tpa1-like proline 4-hydroxylase
MDPKNQLKGEGCVDAPKHFQKILDFIQGPLYHDISNMIKLNGRTEYQLAYYHPNGARYERHRDALPTDDPEDTDQRRVTVVLYLNPGWINSHGGEVKIYSRPDDYGLPEGADRIVKPLLGRILLLLSGVVDHEILATKKACYSLTAWMR